MEEKPLGMIAFAAWVESGQSWQAVADAVVAEYEARRWRSISEAHEDFGLCLFVNMLDPGMYCAGTTLDGNWEEMAEECGWTHFCQIVLTTETVERLLVPIPAPPKEGEHERTA